MELGGGELIECIGVVEVKRRICRHRENAAGIDVHDDSGDAVARCGFEKRLFQLILQFILDIHIDRRRDVIAVGNLDIPLIFKGHIVLPCVLG